MALIGERLTLMQVARELGKSLEQVRRYVREGKLGAEKQGMQWFVERDELAFFKAGGRPQNDFLQEADKVREKIRSRVGLLDVAKMLDESRRSHA